MVEGGNSRADRNRTVGTLEITAQQGRRTVPAGTEVLTPDLRWDVDDIQQFFHGDVRFLEQFA